jgi:inner membrane protein
LAQPSNTVIQMPTVFTHAAVPICTALALGSRRISASALLAGLLASIVPDFDGLAFKLGIAYGGMTGHRGFTHTLGFSVLIGLFGAWLAPKWGLRRSAGWAWITLCAASHSLLDMLTNGGIGIAFLWPVVEARFFSPWRPIEVSPISVQRFLSARGIQVILNEVVTVWAPMMALASAMMIGRSLGRRDGLSGHAAKPHG